MKSRWLAVVGAFVGMALCGAPDIARGGEDEQPQRGHRQGPGRPVERDRDPVQTSIRLAEQLRDAVPTEFKLDENQKTAVADLFAKHLEALQKLAAERPEPSDRTDQEEKIRELERKAQAARESGDRDGARALHRQIRELRQKAQGTQGDEVSRLESDLLKAVGQQLGEDQAAKFQELVRQVRTRTEEGGPMLRLMRGVRRAIAQLDLDEEQRRSVGAAVRKAMKEFDRPGENPATTEQILDHLRTKLHDELGPELGDKFMTALEKSLQEMKAGEEKAASRPGRTPSSGPAEKEDKDAPEPPDDEAE